MGLLKHGICPLLALVHGALLTVSLAGQLPEVMKSEQVVPPDHEFSDLELHTLQVIGTGAHGMMFVGHVLGIWQEGAHFRGVLLVMDSIFFGTIFYSDYSFGYTIASSGPLAVLCVIASLVHAMEPGVFTKDKEKTTKTS